MTEVGKVYGEALYSLAREEGLCDAILAQLKALDESFAQEPAFLRLLAAPNLSKAERVQILDDSFRAQVEPYVLNFLKILTEKGYVRHFHDCYAAYRALYNDENGILCVTAVTAAPLSEAQATSLSEKLSQLTRKAIALENKIDPSVLGGVRLDYDGKRVDDTVAHRLDAIRSALQNTVL